MHTASTSTHTTGTVHTLETVHQLTAPRWHAPLGRVLLLLAQLAFFLLTLGFIIAAIVLNETMILGILDDMDNTTVRITSNEMEIVVLIHTLLKIMMAVLAVFSLFIALLLRKWRRKNKLVAAVHALTAPAPGS